MATMHPQSLSIVTSPTLNEITHHILQLPRELRDMIYAYTVRQEEPINLTKSTFQLNVANTILLEELREAAYAHNTLAVTFSDPERIRDGTAPASIWGVHPGYKQHIRDIIVEVTEARLYHTDLLTLERDHAISRPELRKEWVELLDLPRLEHLTINMQKFSPDQFAWTVFTPILIQLRAARPNVRITFNISFDDLLEGCWNDEMWDVRGVADNEYPRMGFVDISELFETPSEEDREYVREHFPGKKETKGRNAVLGLLSQSAGGKRALALHYVTKEPALMRVMIEEHYKAFKRIRRDESEDTDESGRSDLE